MNDEFQKQIRELNQSVIKLMENSPADTEEIGHALIHNAVSMFFTCAPNHLLAIKTILASVDFGIKMYEENYMTCESCKQKESNEL